MTKGKEVLNNIQKALIIVIILSFHNVIFTMIPRPYQYEPSKINLNIISMLKQMLQFKSTTEIEQELIKQCKALKIKNQKETISDADVDHIKKLWDNLKLLYNYNWLDYITNPFQKAVDNTALNNFINKKISLCIHPDKYESKNKEKITDLFKHIKDESRPAKPMDFPVTVASEIIIYQSVNIIEGLLNKITPMFFINPQQPKNFNLKTEYDKAFSSYAKETQQTEKTIHSTYKEAQQSLELFFHEKQDRLRNYLKEKHGN